MRCVGRRVGRADQCGHPDRGARRSDGPGGDDRPGGGDDGGASAGVPFAEAIAFTRRKVRLPTESWRDLDRGMHARAFAVAGATGPSLLEDFHASLTRALETGETLETWRGGFDRIVARHGWSYRGPHDWRGRVIHDINVRTASRRRLLAANLPLDRGRFVPLPREAIEAPAKIWRAFYRDQVTGRIVPRRHLVAAVEEDRGRRLLLELFPC